MTHAPQSRFWTIVRLDIRLERWRVTAWIMVLAAMPPIIFRSYASLFANSAQRASISKAFGSNASLTVIAGPAHDISTIGGLTAWKCLMFNAVLAAIMSITTVVRRTRGDEEAGRSELLGSTPLSPSTGLAAGVVLGLGASGLVAGLSILGLVVAGSPLLGALGLGGAIGGVGITFVAVSAVAAQVTTTARSANSVAFIVLGVAFALRAVGDTTTLHWLDWLSPLGWTEEISAYSNTRLEILAMFGAASIGLLALAKLLLMHRDLGAGLLIERAGPAAAGRLLSSATGLAWRLDARWLIVWAIGLSTFGAVIGSVTRTIASLGTNNTILTRILGHTNATLTDQFIAQMLGMLSMLAAAAGVQAVLRAHGEEDSGRAEELLATGLSRTRFLGSHLATGLIGSTIVLCTSGFSLGLAALASGARVTTLALAEAIGVELVPCLVLVAAAAALVGCLPRCSVLALPLVIGTYMLTSFGELLRLPTWCMDASVYAHVPRLPGGSADTAALVLLGAVGAGLAAASLIGLQRRDLT